MSTVDDRRATGPGTPQRPARFILGVVGLVAAVLLLGAGGFLWLNGDMRPKLGGPFTLENGNGQTVTDKDFRGKYMLVYFGYTFCPDVCPTTLNMLANALDRLGPAANRLQPIFITVDPQRDTPAVVKRYAAAFTPRLLGLTGSPAQIAKVAKEYRVYYAKHRTGPGPNDYSMDHSSLLYLMGPKGSFVAPLRSDETAAELASRLRRLMS